MTVGITWRDKRSGVAGDGERGQAWERTEETRTMSVVLVVVEAVLMQDERKTV